MSLAEIEFLDFPGCPTAVVRKDGQPFNTMSSFMDSTFQTLGAAIAAGRLVPAGAAFARYETPVGETVTVEAGFPLDEPLGADIEHSGVTVIGSDLPAGRLATVKYHGGYDGLGDAWDSFITQLEEQGYELHDPYWEAYDTEPTPEMDPADLITGLAIRVSKP